MHPRRSHATPAHVSLGGPNVDSGDDASISQQGTLGNVVKKVLVKHQAGCVNHLLVIGPVLDLVAHHARKIPATQESSLHGLFERVRVGKLGRVDIHHDLSRIALNENGHNCIATSAPKQIDKHCLTVRVQ